MNKEEILQKALDKIQFGTINEELYPIMQDAIYQAMSEYAEQEAVLFSRWATGEPIKSELYSIYKQLTKQQ